jgi:hypothetical protein
LRARHAVHIAPTWQHDVRLAARDWGNLLALDAFHRLPSFFDEGETRSASMIAGRIHHVLWSAPMWLIVRPAA